MWHLREKWSVNEELKKTLEKTALDKVIFLEKLKKTTESWVKVADASDVICSRQLRNTTQKFHCLS